MLGLPPEAEAAPPAEAPEAPATPVAGGDDDDMYDGAGDEVMRVGPAKVTELYSPPRVTATLPRLGLVAGSTFDLHKDEAGVAWDYAAARPEARLGAHPRRRAVPGGGLAAMYDVQSTPAEPQRKEAWQG